MKKTLALILSVLAMLVPVSALDLDVAENAAEAVLAEETATLAALPELTDATYGDLIYFSDFDDNTNWVNTDVVGADATASFQLAYVQTGNWGSNAVADPLGANGNVQELIIADVNYNWATGFNMTMQNITLAYSEVTMVWDVYFPTSIEEAFRAQTSDLGFVNISTADYDGEAGGWQTIVMEVPGAVAASGSNYGFNFICNDGTKDVSKSATAGATYYIDNVKVYAKELLYAAKPAEYVEGKGNLVYFDNGNEADTYSNINASVLGNKNVTAADGYMTRDILDRASVQDNATLGIGLQAADGNNFAYADGTDMDGSITVCVEMYNSNTSTVLGFYNYVREYTSWDSWCGGYTNWGSKNAAAGAWSTLELSMTADLSFVGFARKANTGGEYLNFRSIYAYYKPTNNVIIKDITNTSMIDLNGLTEYTLGTAENGAGWTVEGEDTVYAAGATVAAADINGKTLVPQNIYAEKPAEYVEGEGILVYFENGNAEDTYTVTNASILGSAAATSADGYHTQDILDAAEAGASGTFAIGLGTADGSKIAYTDGSAMNGTVKLYIEMYNGGTADMKFYNYVRTKSDWDYWCGGYTNWGGATVKAGEWLTMAVGPYDDLSFIGFGRGAYSAPGLSFRSAYAYYMPYNYLVLNEGESMMVDLGTATEYTFAAPADEVFNAWADTDGNIYKAGSTAAVESINGKTFTPVFDGSDYAPVTEADVEMRLTSDSATNGIRFKASIAPSNKALANEIGFIVARADVLDHLGADLTFDLTAEGVETAEGALFVKGVAYDAATGKDVVADTKEDGSDVFTGVCVGIDIEKKAQVTAELVARPYLKMTVGENEITVYGAENSASLAGAASDLIAAAEAGDAAAAAAYEGAKTYVDTVVATAAAE